MRKVNREREGERNWVREERENLIVSSSRAAVPETPHGRC
jgi:hypothetical protein